MDNEADTASTASKILQTLKGNPRGMTIKQIVDTTGFSRETVTRHLIELGYHNEVYTVRFGNADVYCSNHRKYRDKDVIRVDCGNRTLFINRLENDFGEFIKISETRKVGDEWVPKGSILVSPNHLSDFIEGLKKIKERPNEVQNS